MLCPPKWEPEPPYMDGLRMALELLGAVSNHRSSFLPAPVSTIRAWTRIIHRNIVVYFHYINSGLLGQWPSNGPRISWHFFESPLFLPPGPCVYYTGWDEDNAQEHCCRFSLYQVLFLEAVALEWSSNFLAFFRIAQEHSTFFLPYMSFTILRMQDCNTSTIH